MHTGMAAVFQNTGRALTDRQLYHSVVAAIAAGARNQTAIGHALQREQRSVQHPLHALEEAGFVIATDDALRSRRPIYRIADPIVRFHHVVTRRDLARFEDRRTCNCQVAPYRGGRLGRCNRP